MTFSNMTFAAGINIFGKSRYNNTNLPPPYYNYDSGEFLLYTLAHHLDPHLKISVYQVEEEDPGTADQELSVSG